jgi:hypothetical protein
LCSKLTDRLLSQFACSSEAHPTLTAFFQVWDDAEIEKIFDKYKEQPGPDQKSALLPAGKLRAALEELGAPQETPNSAPVDLDEFKRIARQPNEAEQWFQMIPFASLLSRSLGKATLDELENLQQGQMISRLQVFSQGVKAILEARLEKLKNQRRKFRVLPHGDGKFGGQLDGGDVDDFHRGLSDRLGNYQTLS